MAVLALKRQMPKRQLVRYRGYVPVCISDSFFTFVLSYKSLPMRVHQADALEACTQSHTPVISAASARMQQKKCNRYGKSRLPYDFGYVTMPHGSLNPSIVRIGLYECASTTITLLDRPQANNICESSGVNVKCQHLCPMGISAISCIESAENTWSIRAPAAATKILLPARSKASP